MKHFTVATAGHVDHGKSALVRALTGTDPDRLPEEKKRGITIDLGFARLVLPGLELGIVDVPGHENFVKNMVAGVGSVDAALFVVAADDGWMPQTEEHLQILTYLGVSRAVVALTKSDLAVDATASVEAVRMRLAGSPFADSPIVQTSVVNATGIAELQAALGTLLADVPPPRDIGKPRLPVDRVFSLHGVGTVVTGTLHGGTLSQGQSVSVQPSGRLAHVRSLQNHGQKAERSPPGARTALNLPEVEAVGDAAVTRGEVITLPELGGGSRVLDAVLRRSAHAETSPAVPTPERPLLDGRQLRLHLGSGHWTVRVSLLERGGALLPGVQSLVRLRCERPVFALAGDRFILRDGTGRHTLAGGIVLDPAAEDRRSFRRGAQRKFLEGATLALTAEDTVKKVALACLERDKAVVRIALLQRWPFSTDETEAAVTSLVAAGKLEVVGERVVDKAWWKELRGRTAALVDAEHEAHPERIGASLTGLRRGVTRYLPKAELFDALVDVLVAKDRFVRVGTALRRAAHRPTLPPHFQAAGERLRTALAAKPFEPPSRQELAPDGPSRQALHFLFDTGEALELGKEVVLLEENFRRMRTIILRTLRSAGPSTASDLRQVLGTTRRVLIPVLERLDRDGATRREGDRRALG